MTIEKLAVINLPGLKGKKKGFLSSQRNRIIHLVDEKVNILKTAQEAI